MIHRTRIAATFFLLGSALTGAAFAMTAKPAPVMPTTHTSTQATSAKLALLGTGLPMLSSTLAIAIPGPDCQHVRPETFCDCYPEMCR
jgi:hypothetical protein